MGKLHPPLLREVPFFPELCAYTLRSSGPRRTPPLATKAVPIDIRNGGARPVDNRIRDGQTSAKLLWYN